jgi:hypothetical protein
MESVQGACTWRRRASGFPQPAHGIAIRESQPPCKPGAGFVSLLPQETRPPSCCCAPHAAGAGPPPTKGTPRPRAPPAVCLPVSAAAEIRTTETATAARRHGFSQAAVSSHRWPRINPSDLDLSLRPLLIFEPNPLHHAAFSRRWPSVVHHLPIRPPQAPNRMVMVIDLWLRGLVNLENSAFRDRFVSSHHFHLSSTPSILVLEDVFYSDTVIETQF